MDTTPSGKQTSPLFPNGQRIKTVPEALNSMPSRTENALFPFSRAKAVASGYAKASLGRYSTASAGMVMTVTGSGKEETGSLYTGSTERTETVVSQTDSGEEETGALEKGSTERSERVLLRTGSEEDGTDAAASDDATVSEDRNGFDP